MANVSQVLVGLVQERARVQSELKRLDEAIKALRGIATGNGTYARAFRQPGRRKLSVAARKRIADAQRARWAKWKANRAKKAA